jgi:WD40 repeat protein
MMVYTFRVKIFILFLGLLVFSLTCFGDDKVQQNNQEIGKPFVQMGHTDSVNSIAISSDGKYFVSGGSDNLVKLWDIKKQKNIKTFKASSYVNTVTFSPDDKYIFAINQEETEVWDVRTGKNIRGIKEINTETITVLEGKEMQLTGQEIKKRLRFFNRSHGIQFSAMGKYIATPSNSKKVRMEFWNINTWEKSKSFKETEYIRSITFSPDGKYVVAGGYNGYILVWDINNEKLIKKIYSPGTDLGSTGIDSITFSPDGKYVVTGSRDKTIKLWDFKSWKHIKTFKGHSKFIKTVKFSPDGKYIISLDSDKVSKLWDIKSGKNIFSSKQMDINFSPDAKYMISLDDGKTIKLWDVESGKNLQTFRGHSKKVNIAIFSSDGKYIISASDDSSIKIWSLESEKELVSFRGYRVNQMTVRDKYIISHFNKDLVIKDIKTGKELKRLEGHINPIYGVKSNESGEYVASFDINWKQQENFIVNLKLWDIEKGKEVKTFANYMLSGKTSFIADKYLSVSRPKSYHTPIFLDIESGEEVNILSEVASLKPKIVDLNQDYVVFVDKNNSIALWNIKRGEKIKSFKKNLTGIRKIVISDDSKYIMILSNDSFSLVPRNSSLLQILDIKENGKNIQKIDLPPLLNLHEFIYNSKYFFSFESNGNIQLWDIHSGKNIKNFKGHSDNIISIEFINKGKQMLSSSWDGTIKLWDVETEKELVSMISFDDGEWITITPDGYFDASKNGAKYLNILTDPLTVTSIDTYYEKFYRPDIVQLAMQGTTIDNLPKISDVKSAPIVRILNTEKEVDTDTLEILVKVLPRSGGVGDIRLYHNGTAVVETKAFTKKGNSKPFERSFEVKLVEGQNEIRAIAFEGTNSHRSEFATFKVKSTFKPVQKSKIHALVVGIQEFENERRNLKYTRADAELFVNTLVQGSQGLFEEGKIVSLMSKENTTKEHILKMLGEFKETQAADMFVFYAGSHGMVDGDVYYLITSNVGSVSSRRLKLDAISREELKKAIANIQVSKKMIVLDTCFAGKYGEDRYKEYGSRGMSEEDALNVLSHAIGVNIFAASKSDQEAIEGYKGHGIFTYVLTQGLKKEADQNKDGFVKNFELADYIDTEVPKISKKEFEHKQFPTVNVSGQAFPLSRVQ